MSIKRILREEICKFLIKENLNNLASFVTPLTNNAGKLYNDVANLNDKVANEQMMKFVEYLFQVIHAVNRCVNNNSLNENVPPVLGGNILNHFQRGFFGTTNFVDSYILGNRRVPDDKFKEHVLKSVPLAQLLAEIENQENACNQLFSNSQELANNQQIQQETGTIIRDLKQLRATYQQLVQQQQQQGQP